MLEKINPLPVDYKQIIQNNRLLLLGENHFNGVIRSHIAKYASALKQAGISHYGIEAPDDPKIELLDKKDNACLDNLVLGPPNIPSGRNNYSVAVRAILSEGISLLPIDTNPKNKYISHFNRERHMFSKITSIIRSKPATKIAVLVGSLHIQRQWYDRYPMLGKMLSDCSFPFVSVIFAGGQDNGPAQLLGRIKRAGLAEYEFMADLRPLKSSNEFSDLLTFDLADADFLIHLPQSTYAV